MEPLGSFFSVIKMFRYDWSQFNTKLGLIFMVSSFLVFGLMEQFDFAVDAAGISALLAWITIILVPQQSRRQHLSGLVVYLIVGTALVWLAAVTEASDWARLISMGVVTFAGYLLLLRGPHPFMVAWCLVYWYLLLPLFLGSRDPDSVILGHIIGVSVVIALNLLKPIWLRAIRQPVSRANIAESTEPDRPPFGFVVQFASVVSLAIVCGVGIGGRWLVSDPTLMANATLNIVSPSLKQTRIAIATTATRTPANSPMSFSLAIAWPASDCIPPQE